MSKTKEVGLRSILINNPAQAKALEELKVVLIEKFGKNSEMYKRGVAVFIENVLRGEVIYGVPKLYSEYWQPYQTSNILHHITLKKNVEAIEKHGLEPRDPSPRPWAGMKAIFMGEPKDPLYIKSEQAVLDHVRKKGEQPMLLHIKTNNKLYKSIEPKRTFQVISVDPIAPTEIIQYQDLN